MLSHSASELSAILSAFKSLHGSAAVAAPDGSILLADPDCRHGKPPPVTPRSAYGTS
jgi:hypothetical protein